MLRAEPNRIPLLVYALVLAVVAAWTAGVFLTPVLESHSIGGNALTFLVLSTYGRVCHQIPARSLWIDGRPMAVCARCAGIYCGYLLALAAYPRVRSIGSTDTPPRKWLILGLAPTVIDFSVGYIGLINNTGASRFITGLIAGAAAAFYTLPGLVAMAGELATARKVAKLSPLGDRQ